MRMRTALAKSKNMVSIRILKAIGTKYAQDYVTRFGFEADKHPPYLTMALGAGSVTVWQMARAYSVFANSGYLIQPYYIQRIVDDRGNNLGVANPQHAGDESLRVVDARNAFIMDSMLQDVTRYGTAARASKLGRKDLAGKTGTTNDFLDAWFCGYSPALVGIAWIGFDQPRTLGRNETGGGSLCRSGSATWKKRSRGSRKLHARPRKAWSISKSTPKAAAVTRNSSTRNRCRRRLRRNASVCLRRNAQRPPPLPLSPGGTPEFKTLPSMGGLKNRGHPGRNRRRSRTGRLAGRENHGAAALCTDQAGKRGEELATVARVDPPVAVIEEVKSAGFRRHPEFARRALAVDDHFGPVLEFQFEHAAGLHLQVHVQSCSVGRGLSTAASMPARVSVASRSNSESVRAARVIG